MRPETDLEAVDELSEGDIIVVVEQAQSLEAIGLGAVLELDADEVPLVRRMTSAEFDDEGGSVIGQTLKFRVVLGDLGHVEERDDGLVSSLDEQDLEGVSLEGDAF
jgi:hypothetical protein